MDEQKKAVGSGNNNGFSGKEITQRWEDLIREDHWEIYERAIGALTKVNVRFVLGGAFGLASYTQRLRNTKDLDFFVLPSDRERAVEAITDAGFGDYFPTLAYDRSWIYRSTRKDVIVDIIWETPNHRSQVDEAWFERAPFARIKGHKLSIMPPEELLWIKLYVLQRDRCDWPDLLNLLHATAGRLNWDHLMARVGEDLPLLQGLLSVYSWLCPAKISEIPADARERLGVLSSSAHPGFNRVNLLDSRPWFAAHQPCDEAMTV